MIINVYLDHRIRDMLKCYGSLNDVTNKILELGAEGVISVMDKPTPPPKKDGQQYAINVIEENYIGLVNIYGVKSSRISLRRLLYWFVDNEIFNEVGWEGEQNYVDTDTDKAVQTIGDIKVLLYRLEKRIFNCSEEIKVIRENLNEIEGKIWNV